MPTDTQARPQARAAGVIFGQIQQQDWFEPQTLHRYIAALKKVAEDLRLHPGAPKPTQIPVENRIVDLREIETDLKQFNASLKTFQVPDFDLFSVEKLAMLDVVLGDVAGLEPERQDPNMPNPELMRELLRNAQEVEAAKKDAGKTSNLDAQIRSSLELFRRTQELKYLTVERLYATIQQSSSYIKDLKDIEAALGGPAKVDDFLRQQLMALADRSVTTLMVRQLGDLYDNPSLAASYFTRQLQQRIARDDFLRTALAKTHPEARKQALEDVAKKADETAKQNKPHADVIRKEQLEAAQAHEAPEDTFSITRRPISEVRRLSEIATTTEGSVTAIERALLKAAHHRLINPRLRHRLLSPIYRRQTIAYLLRHAGSPDAQLRYLAGRFGINVAQVRQILPIWASLQNRISVIHQFTPQTLHEAALLRPDLLPDSTVRMFAMSTTVPFTPEQTAVILEVAARTGVAPEIVAGQASGVTEHAVAAEAAQLPAGHPSAPLFQRFQEGLRQLDRRLRPPEPGQPPVVSDATASEFRSVTRANSFRQQIGGVFRFLRIDRAVNAVARSAPVRAVSNVVTAPFRFVGNTINQGVTGVKNWAKTQIIAGATAVGKNLVTWGATQAVKTGIMGVAGKTAAAVGKGLLSVAEGAGFKAIPFIGQAIGAIQTTVGTVVGFVGTTIGSTFDFIRGKKSVGQWIGTIAQTGLKSSGTLLGAAIGGIIGALAGAGIGLLFAGIGALPGLIMGALIGIMVGGMIGGAMSGGLAQMAKDPAEALKSLLGLLLIGGFVAAGLLGWVISHAAPLAGAIIGGGIGLIFGGPIGAAIGAYAGWKFGAWLQSGGLTDAITGAKSFIGNVFSGVGTFLGNILGGIGNVLGNLLTTGQIALRGLFGWIGQAGWALGGGALGSVAGFLTGGGVGALIGGGVGAVGGLWLSGGGLTSLLSGIAPGLASAATGFTSFLGSLVAPTAATSIVAATSVVTLGGIAAATGITMLFVMPSIMSKLYVPPDGGTFGGPLPPGTDFGSGTAVDCFTFVPGGQEYPVPYDASTPRPELSDPWSPDAITRTTESITFIRATYQKYMDKLCSIGEIKLWRDSHHTPSSPSRTTWGGWTMTGNDIRIYNNGVSDNLYTLSHESGHIYSGNFGWKGFNTQHFVDWIPSSGTCRGNIYPVSLGSEGLCYEENFAEGISWFVSGHGTLPTPWRDWLAIQIFSAP